MKKLLFLISAGFTLLLTSCVKNEIATFTEGQIEWDAAAWNANTSPLTYPMMTRVPVYGFATNTSVSPSPLITRTTGTIRLRVNLIGAQTATDRSFSVQFNASESTGVEGTHFSVASKSGVIKANESFAFVDVAILNPGQSTGSRTVVLELLGSNDLKPAVNYAKVGLSINQQ
jgi:hypothetical protein